MMKSIKHSLKQIKRPLERDTTPSHNPVDPKRVKKANRKLKSRIDTSNLPFSKPKTLLDPNYKYWLVKHGNPLIFVFPELRRIIPLKFYWGEPVNHHISREKKRDDWQVNILAGLHVWIDTAEGKRWEKNNLVALKKFAEGEYQRYLTKQGG